VGEGAKRTRTGGGGCCSEKAAETEKRRRWKKKVRGVWEWWKMGEIVTFDHGVPPHNNAIFSVLLHTGLWVSKLLFYFVVLTGNKNKV